VSPARQNPARSPFGLLRESGTAITRALKTSWRLWWFLVGNFGRQTWNKLRLDVKLAGGSRDECEIPAWTCFGRWARWTVSGWTQPCSGREGPHTTWSTATPRHAAPSQSSVAKRWPAFDEAVAAIGAAEAYPRPRADIMRALRPSRRHRFSLPGESRSMPRLCCTTASRRCTVSRLTVVSTFRRSTILSSAGACRHVPHECLPVGCKTAIYWNPRRQMWLERRMLSDRHRRLEDTRNGCGSFDGAERNGSRRTRTHTVGRRPRGARWVPSRPNSPGFGCARWSSRPEQSTATHPSRTWLSGARVCVLRHDSDGSAAPEGS